MDQIASQIGSYLISQGLLGVVVLVLGYVIVRREQKLEELQGKIDTLQEKRLTEALTLQQLVSAFNDKEAALLEVITKGVSSK